MGLLGSGGDGLQIEEEEFVEDKEWKEGEETGKKEERRRRKM